MPPRRTTLPGRPDRGFSVIELMIVVLIVVLITAIAIPVFANALQESRSNALLVELHHVYDALMRYHADHGSFPAEDEFDVETFEPLSSLGYLNSAEGLVSKLVGQKALLYLAPDADGPDSHFVLVTRHAVDPRIVVVAVHTDVISATGGWIDGVYVIDDDELAAADEDLGGGGSPELPEKPDLDGGPVELSG